MSSSTNNQNYPTTLPHMDLSVQEYQQRESDNLDFLDELNVVSEIQHYPVVMDDPLTGEGCGPPLLDSSRSHQYQPGPSMNNSSMTRYPLITAATTNNQGIQRRDTTAVPLNTNVTADTPQSVSSFGNVDMTPKNTSTEHSAQVFPAEVGPSKASKVAKICQVCGDRAKSLHFGGLSCDSCKAFFRRAVQQDNAFRCAYGNECQITISTRKSCQSCRFLKCLDIGMEKKWVMSDEERVSFQKQRLEKKQQQENKPEIELVVEPQNLVQNENKSKDSNDDDDGGGGSTKQSFEPQVSQMLSYMTAEDQEEIESLVHKFHQSYIDIPYRVSQCHKNRNSIEIIEMFTTILRRMVYFHTKMSDFNQLSPLDQSTLLRQGVLEMCMLRSALTYDFTNNRWPKKTGNMEFLKHCPTLHIEDMKKLVTPDLYNLQMSFIAGMQDLNADEPIVVLLTLVVLFYPDRTGLEDLGTVGRIQDKYLRHLKNYTEWRFGPNASKIYAKLLTKLSDLRQLNDSHNEYNLRLEKSQINQIQSQMSKINLNPYTQWDLVQCDQDKVVGNVSPVSKSNQLSTTTTTTTTTTAAAEELQNPRKSNIIVESPRVVAKKRLIPASGPATNTPPTISSLHAAAAAGAQNPAESSMVRKFFKQMVNRQIPIFLENPMATLSTENEMEGASKYFAAIGGARLPTMGGRGDGGNNHQVHPGLIKFPNMADFVSMSSGMFAPPPQSHHSNSSAVLDAHKQQQLQHTTPVEVNHSACTVKPQMQFSLPPHHCHDLTTTDHRQNQNSVMYNIDDPLVHQFAKMSGLNPSAVLKQQQQRAIFDQHHPTIISCNPTLPMPPPSRSFMADQPSTNNTLGTFQGGHHHPSSSSVEPIQYSPMDMNKVTYNDLGHQDKNKLEEQYYGGNSSIGMPYCVPRHMVKNPSAAAASSSSSSYPPSAVENFYLDGNVDPIYAMNHPGPPEENSTIGHHGQEQELLYSRFLDQQQVHNYFDYEQQQSGGGSSNG